jgi:hypothetical protein
LGVELAASFDPVTPWVDLFTAAVTNVSTIGQDWLADPAPALRQLGTNFAGYADTTATALGGAAKGAFTYFTTTVPEALRTAFQQIADGDLSGAAATINNALGAAIFAIGLPLFPVLDIPGKMAENFTAVIKTVTGLDTLVPLLLGVLSPLEGSIQSFGDGAQAVLDAVAAGDAVTAFNAALNVVPTVLGAVLNGYTDLMGNQFAGLLTPEAGGLVYSLAVTIPRAIATALGATAPPAASKTAASAEVVSTEKQGTVDTASGTGQSKRAISVDSAASPEVKDGNKFEPGQVSDSTATGTRTAATKRAASNSSDATATTGSTAKGHSARQGAGADK